MTAIRRNTHLKSNLLPICDQIPNSNKIVAELDPRPCEYGRKPAEFSIWSLIGPVKMVLDVVLQAEVPLHWRAQVNFHAMHGNSSRQVYTYIF